MTKRADGLPPSRRFDAIPRASSATSLARSRAEEYERAVRMAILGIYFAGHKTRRGGKSELDALVEKLRRPDEIWTENERARAAALIAQQTTPRKRGRPKGTGAEEEKMAVFAASIAVLGTDLNWYRNEVSPHRLSRCDAIAEAMRWHGFKRLNTANAVVAHVRKLRKGTRQFRDARREFQKLYHTTAAAGRALRAQWEEAGRAFRAQWEEAMQPLRALRGARLKLQADGTLSVTHATRRAPDSDADSTA
jgi:hypothetical protein